MCSDILPCYKKFIFNYFPLKHLFFNCVSFKVDGGSTISIKVSWIQKLLYRNGEFSLIVPFSFPDYVTPPVKKLAKKEKIQLNINSGTETEIMCKATSHPLKVYL